MKNGFHIILTLQSRTKNRCLEQDSNLHLQVLDIAVLIELSSQRELVASLIQFKHTKYFRDDVQCKILK